jgi:hypothetical protein
MAIIDGTTHIPLQLPAVWFRFVDTTIISPMLCRPFTTIMSTSVRVSSKWVNSEVTYHVSPLSYDLPPLVVYYSVDQVLML